MRFAIVENNKISNVIVVEPEIANELFDNAVKETETTGNAWIGARFNGEKFEPLQPYRSWVWNEDTFDYNPPKPKPSGDYYWNEAEQDWLQIIKDPEPTEEEK